jgi:hypothetical protein
MQKFSLFRYKVGAAAITAKAAKDFIEQGPFADAA